jgi:small-conductance mechanosensitive channel
VWIGLRDFIAGAIFKTNRNLNLNDTIKIDKYNGKVIKFTSNKLVMETESGEIIYIPYASLFGKTIIKSHPAETILNYTFRFEIPQDADIQQTTERINTDIINLPWSSLKKEPQIKPIGETEFGFMLEVTVFSMERDYFPEIERIVKRRFVREVTQNQ